MDSDPEHYLFLITLNNIPHAIICLCIALFCFILVFLLQLADAAFFNLNSKDFNLIKNHNSKNSRKFLALIDHAESLSISLELTSLFFSIAFMVFALVGFEAFVSKNAFTFFQSEIWKSLLGLSIFALLIFLFLAFICYTLARMLAKQSKTKTCLFLSPMVLFFYKIWKPLLPFLMEKTSFGAHKQHIQLAKEMSTEDIQEAIEEGRNHSASVEEVNIFKSILAFDEIQVKQIMRPRMEIIALEKNSNFEMVKNTVAEQGYSRMPVYEKSKDSIIGVIHTKDLLPHLDKNEFDWLSLMRKAMFIPETKYAQNLLQDFRKNKVHMAIVVNEFGGTAGLITLEDIMEEITGDINDEFDHDELNASKIDNHTYIFSGNILINDACRFANLPIDSFDEIKGESESLAGLVLELARKFPQLNEKISHEPYQFTIIEIENNKIEKIKLEIQG